MQARIPPALRALPVALLILACGSTHALDGQARDARIPEPGQAWFEIGGELLNWTEQFAEGGEVADGSREPLFAHFDGPVAARLFPGPAPFIDDLNAEASGLGYDPVTESEFSLGDLDFSTMLGQVRTLEVGVEMGVFSRLSLGVRAPFTLTQVEPSFVFDSVSATATYADLAFPAEGAFFTDARVALASLQGLIDGGTLTGDDLAAAIALRDDTDTFLAALERRSADGALIPTAGSVAGGQMSQRYAGFLAGFEGLGLELPGLGLPETARRADLIRLFQEEPIFAFPPGRVDNGLNLGEVELSARFGLIDQITRREAWIPPAPDTAPAPREVPGGETVDPPVSETAGEPTEDRVREEGRPSIRLRTSVGAMLRVPIRSASFPPFQNAAHFLDIPIGDGQTDIELALYQDVAVGEWLIVRSALRYGIQRPDEVILRVAPPDRPYALSALQTVVRRDLGDYLLVLVRPSLRINSTLSVGLEWDYFRLGQPSYGLAQPLTVIPDASPLELEGAQTRQRIGVGFVYDLTEARGRGDLVSGARPVGPPWQFGISLRRAVSGSGGRTPASFRFAAEFRVPIRFF